MSSDSDPGAQGAATPAVAEAAPDRAEELYHELERRVRASRPHENLESLHKSYLFAAERHAGQLRQNGEPYITHPLDVA